MTARIAEGKWPTPRLILPVISSDDDGLLGTVSRYWVSQETMWMSIGITIFDSRNWGRGLGFEALGMWADYLFEALPTLARLDLRTWSGNPGMMRLAEKLGFREEARFRKARIVGDQYYDGMGYGILREEWTWPQG